MSDTMQFSNRQLSDEAKRLEEQGKFAEAAQLYKQAYDSYPGSFVTSHYIKCLRKEGQAAEAIKFGRQLPKLLQDDSYVHRELSWAMYEVYLKKTEVAEENEFDDEKHEQQSGSDFQKMQEVANYILAKASMAEDVLRTRTIFAICNEAKRRKNWQIVYEFANRVVPERLSTQQEEVDGRKLLSDYQNWLRKMAKSLLELKRYEECLNFTKTGIENYPRDKQFFRWKAYAQKALGQIEEALQEFEQIDRRFPKEWYIQSDIADIYVQLHKHEEARVWYCKAASCFGDIKFRYKMFQQMSMLFKHLGDLEEAYDHLQLACAITEREGWETKAAELRGQLLQFKRRQAEHTDFHTKTSKEGYSVLLKRCKVFWREIVSTATPSFRGQLVKLNEEKGFGFIQRNDGTGKDIYFKFRSLARGLIPLIGMIVEFEIDESFDSGKNQESQAAVNIRHTNPHSKVSH